MTDSIVVKSTVTFRGEFRDTAGNLLDPATVRFLYRTTNTDAIVLTYSTAPSCLIVRDSRGLYHVTLPINRPGHWGGRWEAEDGDLILATPDVTFTTEPTMFYS